ncbi:MAG: hypothetical protein WC453_04720 [Patescibacteria group bacterium]
MKKLRKLLVIGVMVLSVLAMSGIVVTPAKAAASAGDLIKMAGNSSVYYLGSDGKRYVFPNSTTYFSWYTDFSGVVTIPSAELQSYPLGGNVTMRPGTKLVKITTDPSVYAVEPNGVLRKIQSEAQASSLYGTNWNKRVVDVPDAFFTNYTIGSVLANGAVPAGSLVKNANSSTVYYYDGTNYRQVSSESALTANKLQLANVLTLSSAITAGGTAISSAETALVNVAQNGGTGVVVTGSGLMISLSSSTAAASNVVTTTAGGQAIANFATFNFTAANDGAVTVKTLKVKRVGISSDNTVSSVYLYDGNTKLTDAGSLSNGYVTFSSASGLFTVAAGQTKSITVKADIAANATGNIGFAVNAASDVVSTGASVTGSFPLTGNTMSVVTATDLAAVTAATQPTPSSTGTIDAGTNSVTLWSDSLSVSQRMVSLKYVSFRQIGSASADAIQNIKLYINGSQVGNASSIGSDGRVTFDLNASPASLNTGSSLVELRGDIVKGSNYNYIFSIQTASDIVLVDSNYGVNVTLTGVGGANILPLSTAQITINPGSVSVQQDPNFTATQFVANQAQTVLGQWTMKAYGEDVKVQSLKLTVALTGTVVAGEGFNNVTLYANGGSVGSSQNAVATAGGAGYTKDLTFGTTNLFTIPAGTTYTLTVKGDSVLTTGTGVTGSTVNLAALNNAYQGLSSFTYTNEVASPTITLTTGSSNATISKNGSYNDQSISFNTTKQKIGSYLIQASSADGVRVTSLTVALVDSANAALGVTDLQKIANLYVVTPDMPNGSTPVNPASSNNFSTNFTIAANQTAQVDVYADLTAIPTGAGSDHKIGTTLLGNGNGSTSNQAVTLTKTGGGAAAGQKITVATGALAASSATLSNSSPVSQILVGGTNGVAMATFNFVAASAGVTISELGFTGISDKASSVTVNGQTAAVVGGNALVTGLNIVVPTNYGGIDVPVTANLAPVGIGGVTNGTISLVLGHIKYLAGGTTTVAESTVDAFSADNTHDDVFTAVTGTPANVMYLAGVAPVVNLVAATGSLTTGTVKIGSVNIVAPTGNVTLLNMPITVSASGATFTNDGSAAVIVKDASNGQTITTTGGVNAGAVTIDFGTGYTITAGQTGKTLDIYVPGVSFSGAAGTARVNLGLGQTKTAFTWKDVNGNTNTDATYILNYPNTTVSLGN